MSRQTREGFIVVGLPTSSHYISVSFCTDCEAKARTNPPGLLETVMGNLRESKWVEDKNYDIQHYEGMKEHWERIGDSQRPHWEITNLE
jgi:hypothetical protein